MARPIDAERLRGYFLPDHAFTGTLKWKGKTGDEFIATSPLGVTLAGEARVTWTQAIARNRRTYRRPVHLDNRGG